MPRNHPTMTTPPWPSLMTIPRDYSTHQSLHHDHPAVALTALNSVWNLITCCERACSVWAKGIAAYFLFSHVFSSMNLFIWTLRLMERQQKDYLSRYTTLDRNILPILNNYWMRLSRIQNIIQAEVNVENRMIVNCQILVNSLTFRAKALHQRDYNRANSSQGPTAAKNLRQYKND